MHVMCYMLHYSYRDPLQLCQFLLSQCLSRNVHVLHPVIVTDIITSPDNTIAGLTVRSPAGSRTMRPCNTLLQPQGCGLHAYHGAFPTGTVTVSLPITHLSGHSVVLRSPHWTAPGPGVPQITGCQAIFTTNQVRPLRPRSSAAQVVTSTSWG
jgi:hypothetical protein